MAFVEPFGAAGVTDLQGLDHLFRSDSFNTACAAGPVYKASALKQEKDSDVGTSTLRIPNPQPFDHSLPSPTDSYRTNGSPFGSTSSLAGGKRSDTEVSKSEATPTLNDSTALLCDFLRGSSVADTPVSSPSSDEESATSEKGGFVDIKPSLQNKIPEEVKLPQRKGGMQLWQFLYSLLEEGFTDIIQYTESDSKLEFRLIEPDAVAIWWGHQKNRPNMNYDKLSRSLRYYYDKKIIQKVNGERYVYRFCCNPEYLYEALGNSESRPKLKDMPESAKRAMEQNQSLLGGGLQLSPGGQMMRAVSAEQLTALPYSQNIEMNALPIYIKPSIEMSRMPETHTYSAPSLNYGTETYPRHISPSSPYSPAGSEWGYPAPAANQTLLEPPYNWGYTAANRGTATGFHCDPQMYGYDPSIPFSAPGIPMVTSVAPPTTSMPFTSASQAPYYLPEYTNSGHMYHYS